MKNMEADVIVIAGGMSGLAASIAAAEKGASVIVFEKSSTTGGAANMGMGFFGVESHIQKRSLDNLTVDKAFKMMMEFTHWRVDARLIRKYYEQSASTVKWIESMGVEFLGAYKYFKDSQMTWHLPKVPGTNKPTERSASYIVKKMTDYAMELGVEFYFNTSVKRILKSDTRITGVVVQSGDGVEFEAESDCVIVCTGGFGANVDMIKEHLGYNHGEDLFSFRIPGLEGEGMRMVWEIGGGHSPVNIEMTYEAPGFPGGTLADTIFRQPNLMVNLNGVRFINEEIMCNTPFTGNAINIQKGRFGISVVSDELLDSYLGKGLDFVGYHKDAICYIDNWRNVFDEFFCGVDVRTEDKEIAGAMMGIKDPNARFFFQANSLEDLAEQTGIDKKNFLKTVEEYNAACEGRGDDFFGKNIRYMRPIRGKKFYAMKFGPSGYGSLGGIKVNDFLQVLTDAGDPIPGLYSAGTDCCGIFGDTYDFYLPGSTMGFAINSGRMAGMNAVDYIDSSNFVE